MTLAAAALGAFAVVRLRGRSRLVFLVTAAAMAAAYAGYQYSVFGTLSPFARYAGAMPPAMARSTPLRTLIGLFVDGAYGLLPYAPVFVLALAGLPLLLRRGGRERWALLLVGLGVLLPVLGWRNWWGFSPPARFTIPLVPVLAVAIAAPPRGGSRPRARSLALGARGGGARPGALHVRGAPGDAHGERPRRPAPGARPRRRRDVSLSRYLPYLSSRAGSAAPPWEPPPSEARVTAVWVAALVAVLLLDRLAWSRDRVDRWFRGLALPILLFLAVSVAVDRWARPEGPPRLRPPPPATAS